MIDDNRGHVGPTAHIYVGLLVAGLVSIFIAAEIHSALTDPALEAQLNLFAEWCQARGGELQHNRVMGDAGGIQCGFEDGTRVSMGDVEGLGDRP